MPAPSLGKRAGTMHVRVLPNTRGFPRDLKKQLDRIEKSMPPMKIDVSKANVAREKIRRSIQAQLASLRDFEIDVDVKANVREARRQLESVTKPQTSKVMLEVDRAMLQRISEQINRTVRELEPKLRIGVEDDEVRWKVQALRREFDRLSGDLNLSVLSAEETARIRHRIHEINDELDELSKDRTVRIDINPFTAWASARLAWLTRPRFVDIIPRVSKAALTKAATMLAALSGARLSYDYLKRFSDWMSEVDKKLPRLTFGVTGLTTAFSMLMGSLSGLVGIGDGLAATLPSLLLVPGLMAGAAMSGIALFVALKESKDELAELGDSYTNLGKIIKKSFWGEARQPIIDFSNSIMPQLERSFKKTSLAIGRFTASLAASFQTEFAGGRLEAMFDGLTASWDELTKGTDAFAGAVTNLGLVAAKYMPRLASWFVRQANTFDNWLSTVATDGRLKKWIQESIDSFYAIWDVSAATTGILQALWQAAERAGSGGLRGFADMLLSWEKAVQGSRWQETLVAMFRGAGDALGSFGDGLRGVGQMLYEQRDAIEYFMATAGQVLGDFIGDVAEALSRPAVADGMRRFIDGISNGLGSLKPSLGPLADAFGTLAGFVGDLADAVGPVLSEALRIAAPLLEELLDAIDTEGLSDALVDGLRRMTPSLQELADGLIPLIPSLIDLAEEAIPLLVDVLDLITPLLSDTKSDGGKTGILAFLDDWVRSLGQMLDVLNEIKDDDFSLDSIFDLDDSMFKSSTISNASIMGGLLGPFMLFREKFLEELENVRETVGEFFAGIGSWLIEKGTELLTGLLIGVVAGVEPVRSWFAGLWPMVTGWLASAGSWLISSGVSILTGLLQGIVDGYQWVANWFASLPALVTGFFASAASWLLNNGTQIMNGLRSGVVTGYQAVANWLASMPGKVRGFFAGVGTWLLDSGRALLQGFADGIRQGITSAVSSVKDAMAAVAEYLPHSPAPKGPFSGRGWVSYSGEAVGKTFGSSIVESLGKARVNVRSALGGVQSEFTRFNAGRPSIDVSDTFRTDRARTAVSSANAVRSLTASAFSTGHLATGRTAPLVGEVRFEQANQRDQFREFEQVLERIDREG